MRGLLYPVPPIEVDDAGDKNDLNLLEANFPKFIMKDKISHEFIEWQL